MIFGVAPDEGRISISPFQIYNEETTILGTMAVLNSFEPAMRLLEAGVVNSAAMVTHTFALEDFDSALHTMRERQGLKIQISFA